MCSYNLITGICLLFFVEISKEILHGQCHNVQFYLKRNKCIIATHIQLADSITATFYYIYFVCPE